MPSGQIRGQPSLILIGYPGTTSPPAPSLGANFTYSFPLKKKTTPLSLGPRPPLGSSGHHNAASMSEPQSFPHLGLISFGGKSGPSGLSRYLMYFLPLKK